MELKLINDKGAAGTIQAKDEIFGRDFNESLVHQVVVAYQANARIGSRAQKDAAPQAGGKPAAKAPAQPAKA